MLFQGLLDLILWIFDIILDDLDFPNWVGDSTIIAQFLAYIASGVEIVATYTHFTYLLTLLGLVIAIDTFFMAYKFVMWVLRKLPFVNIS